MTDKNATNCSFYILRKRGTLKKLIGVQLIYNVILVSAVQKSESVLYIMYSFLFRLFSHIDNYGPLSRVPCTIQ